MSFPFSQLIKSSQQQHQYQTSPISSLDTPVSQQQQTTTPRSMTPRAMTPRLNNLLNKHPIYIEKQQQTTPISPNTVPSTSSGSIPIITHDNIILNDIVLAHNIVGIVKYIGPMFYIRNNLKYKSKDIYIGIECMSENPSNIYPSHNGVYQNFKYFETTENKNNGLLIPLNNISKKVLPTHLLNLINKQYKLSNQLILENKLLKLNLRLLLQSKLNKNNNTLINTQTTTNINNNNNNNNNTQFKYVSNKNNINNINNNNNINNTDIDSDDDTYTECDTGSENAEPRTPLDQKIVRSPIYNDNNISINEYVTNPIYINNSSNQLIRNHNIGSNNSNIPKFAPNFVPVSPVPPIPEVPDSYYDTLSDADSYNTHESPRQDAKMTNINYSLRQLKKMNGKMQYEDDLDTTTDDDDYITKSNNQLISTSKLFEKRPYGGFKGTKSK